MALQDKIWKACTIHEVAAEFLKSERHRVVNGKRHEAAPLLADDLKLIDRPDLQNPLDNHRRWHLLYQLRGPLLVEIPPDTEWYRVSNLTPQDFPELHIIARCGWDDAGGKDRNELFAASKRCSKILKTMPTEWGALILWGHSKAGPFTIIEGNNRLAAYAALLNPLPLNTPVIIGLSPTLFHYHIFDPAGMIADDLWK